ncbi:UNVERIFIED_CONTAM: Insulinase (Peptidase M16) [Siphonaria sp. JEL0065]|nr:Insulinase (Peptidase M16) [Siphonaria sp. JEL0065]
MSGNAAFDGIRESTSGFIITLHPLVILNLSDHFTRMRMQSQNNGSSSSAPKTIFGAIIGTQSGREIEIFNSYELPYSYSNDKGFVINNEYFMTKQEKFREVFPKYDLLGWYSVGSTPTEADLAVHKQILEHNESPLFIQLNPIINPVAKELPLGVYESVVDLEGGGNQMRFAKSKYKIETGEAERIALDHVARVSNAETDRGSSLVANLTGQRNAIKMLHARVQILKAYIRDVENGTLPRDHELMRQVSAVCQRLPTMNSLEFRQEFLSDYNDILLGTYLASITKGTHAMNELVEKINVISAERKSSKGSRGLSGISTFMHLHPKILFHTRMTSSIPPPFTAISTPDLDDRRYALLTLSNKLQCLVVSDPAADKAATAMDVHVGHLNDPVGTPGLAHFCEHLLFMGNEKYPSENEYSQYLSAHGGSSNAFTGADHTNYYFDIKAEFLEGALDRFTQFFVSPLFDASCTDREMKAVDSEHKKNIQVDAWRIYQLQKDLTSKEHPFCKFGTGNLVTLKEEPERKGIDVRKVLLDFHSQYYSANIMKMVVIGKESVEQLSEWVIEKTSAIKNKDIPVPSFPGHPLGKEECLKQISIKPVKDSRTLQLTFPLPDLSEFYLCKPSNYISHLIGHESEGSILALLKQKGWAQDLSAGASSGAVNFSFFKISVGLTDEGSKHWEEIVVMIFQYIEMLNEKGVQQWIYDECKILSEVRFRFEEKRNPASFASRVAGDLHDYPPNHILSGPSVMFEMNKKHIEDVLAVLRVDNFRITLVSPDFDSSSWSKAPWYGTEYLHEPISESLKASLLNIKPVPAFHLPLKNEFVPENFSIRKTSATAQKRPDIVLETETIRLWHKKDDTFWVPKAKVVFTMKSPLGYVTPTTCVLTRLYTDCLTDALNEFSYYAHVAGLDYYMSNSTEGIELSISGYNDKVAHLLHRIIQASKSLKIDPKRFVSIKEELGRSYKNWSMEQPYQHASFFSSFITQERLWTSDEKLQVLEDLTAEDVMVFYPQLLGRLHIEGFVFGNVEVEDAIKLGKLFQDELAPKPLPSQLHNQTVRTHIFPNGKHLIHTRPIANVNQVNSAIEHLIQIGDVSNSDLRVRTMLFAQIAKEPCFNVLRTQEQLGYIVASGIRKQTGMISFRVLVQSERGPAYIENRAELFLKSLRTTLLEMSETEFQKNINALIFNLVEKDKNLSQEANRLWGHISNRYYDFEEEERDAALVSKITLAELIEFYDLFISPASRTRRILSVHLHSSKAKEEECFVAGSESVKTGADNEGSGNDSAEDLVLSLPRVVVGVDGVADLKAGMSLSKCPVPVTPLNAFRVGVSKM